MARKIGDHEVEKIIFEKTDGIYYKATHGKTNNPIIIKSLKSDYPTNEELEQIQSQYDLLKKIDLPDVIRPLELQKYKNSLFLILEDFDGIPLHEFAAGQPVAAEMFFKIAENLVKAVSALHEHNILHKELTTETIFVQPKTLEVKIVDMTFAASKGAKAKKMHPYSLAFISPELAGKMPRAVDFRSDIYSLGVVFYELLIGKLPFSVNNPLETIHEIVSFMPVPPSQTLSSVPVAASDIVMRCMSKYPEDRYHSIKGLLHDLSFCREKWNTDKKALTNFQSAQNDASAEFYISDKLYGRKKELQLLKAAFNRACSGNTEWLLIGGNTGVGMRSLALELQKNIEEKRGYFLRGRFEPFLQHFPYSAIVEACRELVRELLTESDERIAEYRKNLLVALQNNGQVLIDLIPELEILIGRQPEVSKLEGEQNRARFLIVLMQFIQVLAQKEHPLVLFLDKLENADFGSINAIKVLSTDTRIKHLLIISTYNEVALSNVHPLTKVIAETQHEGGAVEKISVGPLGIEDVRQLIADTMQSSKDRVEDLSKFIFQKTNGNPFFIKTLLKALYKDGYIQFDHERNQWQWQLERMQTLVIPKDISGLLLERLKKFNPETTQALFLAAVIGPRFSLRLLSLICNVSQKKTLQRLQPAFNAEFIRSDDNTNSFLDLAFKDTIEADNACEELHEEITFANEVIYETAGLLGPDQVKREMHYKLAKILQDEDGDENIFAIIYHFNNSRGFIVTPDERRKLAMLNIKACRKAKASAAISMAYEAISAARSLLSQDAWSEDYELKLSVFLESAELDMLLGRYDELELFTKEIFAHADSKVDKGKLYALQIKHYSQIGNYQKVFQIASTLGELFDIPISPNPHKLKILWELLKVKRMLRKTPIASLERLAPCTDPEHAFIIQFLNNLLPMAFIHDKALGSMIILIMMRQTLERGNTEMSCLVFSSYSILLGFLNDYHNAYEFAKLAIQMAEATKNKTYCARCYAIMSFVVNHWVQPYKTNEEYIDKGINNGIDAGEFLELSLTISFMGFLDGTFYRSIPEAKQKLLRYKDFLYSSRNQVAIKPFEVRLQLCKSLTSPNFMGPSLTDDHFDDEEFYKIVSANPQLKTAQIVYCVYKCLLLYLLGYYSEALALYEGVKEKWSVLKGLITEKDLYFYNALNLAAIYPSVSFLEKRKLMTQIKKDLKFYASKYAFCPATTGHRKAIIEGEIARLQGKLDKAVGHYDDAIRMAQKNEFVGDEALANELAARLYLSLNKTSVAKAYLHEAYYKYHLWGAKAKVAQLERQYPQMLEEQIAAIAKLSEFAELSTAEAVEAKHTGFDLTAVLRASAVLSKEIHLEKLLKELLQLACSESGSDRAIFLMEQDGELLVQGEKRWDKDNSDVMMAHPLGSQGKFLSIPIVKYVLRTKEKIVLNDAGNKGMFSKDSYITNEKIKSLLCMPVIYQGKLSGILYLENGSDTDVFTPEKTRVLEMLSAQIATSIENSTLYTKLEEYNKNLEEKVQERTEEIVQKNIELAQTLDELKTAQHQLIESEKLAALGQLIAGIAHEINTPLGAVRASSENAREAIKTILSNLSSISKLLDEEKKGAFINLIQLSVQNETEAPGSKEERKIKRNLAENFDKKGIENSYEVADLLVDMGIYKDISDIIKPLGEKTSSVLNLAYNMSSILKNNLNIQQAVEKAAKIVFALKTYIHHEESGQMMPSNLIDGIESVLTLYQHQIKQNVSLEKDFQQIPLVPCRMHELNQVWTNLIHNALQAMENEGVLKIKIYEESGFAIIEVTDSGKGIPSDIQARIFTPFFTTKSRGEGSGLGLSISKQIIDAHSGKISFQSVPGKTTFAVKIPLEQAIAKVAA